MIFDKKELKLLLSKSLSKITTLRQSITTHINLIFNQFDQKFRESFEKETSYFENLNTDELEESMQKLKEQLKSKFDKIENLASIITEFKVSPILQVVDPVLLLPRQSELSMEVSSESDSGDRIKPQCPLCSQRFKAFGIIKLKNHLNTEHNMILKFQCPECEFNVDNHFLLPKHLLQSHSMKEINDKLPTYICRFTNKKYHHKQTLAFLVRNDSRYHKIL